MFATSQSLVHTPPNPPGGGAQGEMESPRNPFSISVILSDEVGQKRSPPSNSSTPSFSFTDATPLSRNNRQRRQSQDSTEGRSSSDDHTHFFHTPVRPPHHGSGGSLGARASHLSLSEAGSLATTPPTNNGLVIGTSSSSRGATGTQPHHRTPSHSNNSSITASPFNASLLQALTQQQATTPTNKGGDILDDSLGMLSTVALLDSEISSANTTAGTSVQEKLAGMRIHSHREGSTSSHDEEMSGPHGIESSTMVTSPSSSRKSHTPHILKRDRRRQRKQSLTDSSKLSTSSASGGDSTHFNTGFLSPLAQGNSDHTSKQHFTFSPSIFLSRPDSSDDPSPKRARPTSLSSGNPHQGGIGHAPGNYPVAPLSPSSESDGGIGEEFVTSTPIKSDKENVHRSGKKEGGDGAVGGGGAWSPSILQTSGGSRRQFLKEANDASSGSDSELPVKKLKTTPLAHTHQQKRRKSKARTKLSPLLENACSPIAKADHTHQPSPLVTSVTSTPSRSISPPHTQAPSTSNAVIGQLRPPISAESAQPPVAIHQSSSTSYNMQGASPYHAHLVTNIPHSRPIHHPQQQQQPRPLPCQPVPNIFSMLPTSPPTPQSLLPMQTSLINPALGYPFNPMVTTFGGLIPMQGYAPPVCVPGFLPGMPFYNPQAQLCTTQSMYPSNLANSVNFMGNSSQLVAPKYGQWNGSICASPHASSSSHNNSQLQSVPPWFIFSDKRADSKRSRLSEAINKSLSETPSQKTKLPAEWSKYACGQTDDQRKLTEEARSFLLLRPRQLHFGEES